MKRDALRDLRLCFIAQTRTGIQSSLIDRKKGLLMTPSPSNQWQQLAEQASNEMDPDKLLNLVIRLNQLLGEQEERSRALLHRGTERMSFPAAV